jgi:hypothetical protein
MQITLQRTVRALAFSTLPLLLLLLSAPALMAQSQTISGTIADQTGAVIPNAHIKITDTAKGTLARDASQKARSCRCAARYSISSTIRRSGESTPASRPITPEGGSPRATRILEYPVPSARRAYFNWDSGSASEPGYRSATGIERRRPVR